MHAIAIFVFFLFGFLGMALIGLLGEVCYPKHEFETVLCILVYWGLLTYYFFGIGLF